MNAVAGASRVSPRDFFAGTVIGIPPVIALAATFVDRLQAALSEPGPVSYAALAVNVTLIVVAAASVWRRFGRGDVPYLKEFNAGVIIVSSVAGRFGYANRGPYFTARWGRDRIYQDSVHLKNWGLWKGAWHPVWANP